MDVKILAETLADETSHGLLTFDIGFAKNSGWSSLKKHDIWRKGFTVSDYVDI